MAYLERHELEVLYNISKVLDTYVIIALLMMDEAQQPQKAPASIRIWS